MLLIDFLKVLVLSTGLEMAYVPNSSSTVFRSLEQFRYYNTDNVFFLEVSPRLDHTFFYVSGDVRTYMSPYKRGAYPHQAYYGFEAAAKLKSISIGYGRYCHHAVFPTIYFDERNSRIDGVHEKIFIKATISKNLFQ
jgi:hypothetical protein